MSVYAVGDYFVPNPDGSSNTCFECVVIQAVHVYLGEKDACCEQGVRKRWRAVRVCFHFFRCLLNKGAIAVKGHFPHPGTSGEHFSNISRRSETLLVLSQNVLFLT